MNNNFSLRALKELLLNEDINIQAQNALNLSYVLARRCLNILYGISQWIFASLHKSTTTKA